MNLLLAAVLLLQDTDAEDSLKKIEETIEQAPSFFCTFKADGKAQLNILDKFRRHEGSISLKHPDKFILAAQVQEQPGSWFLWCSNGDRAVGRKPGGSDVSLDRPESLKNAIAANFIRAGPYLSFLAMQPPASGTDKGLVRKLPVKDVVREPGDDRSRAISFKLVLLPSDRTAAITLWYDPKDMLPLRRKVEFSGDDEEIRLTEVYKWCTLNLDIPDEKFKLPEEKR